MIAPTIEQGEKKGTWNNIYSLLSQVVDLHFQTLHIRMNGKLLNDFLPFVRRFKNLHSTPFCTTTKIAKRTQQQGVLYPSFESNDRSRIKHKPHFPSFVSGLFVRSFYSGYKNVPGNTRPKGDVYGFCAMYA